jgi:hypothetical protein
MGKNGMAGKLLTFWGHRAESTADILITSLISAIYTTKQHTTRYKNV